jgi:hypothetical protein
MNPRVRLQAAVTAAALIAVVVHHAWPAFHADAFTGTFLLVAVLPWLAPLLKSIKLPGGLEVELREMREELDQTKGAVQSAAIQAQVGAAALGVRAAAQVGVTPQETPSRESLLTLGAKYEQIRDSMPAGSKRTEAMTRVLAEMFKQSDSIPDLDVRPLLASGSRGERLAGIAYVHAHPSSDRAEPLVRALSEHEDTPFGQYWALRALRHIAEVDRRVFVGPLCEGLKVYKDRQKPGTDRHYEATQLLRDAGCSPASKHDA